MKRKTKYKIDHHQVYPVYNQVSAIQLMKVVSCSRPTNPLVVFKVVNEAEPSIFCWGFDLPAGYPASGVQASKLAGRL